MKLSRLVSALLLLTAVYCIASYGLPVPELVAQESGTISIIIGGSSASTSSSSYRRGGGGGWESCTIISLGDISCAFSSTSGGEGTPTTTSTAQSSSSLLTVTVAANATETSTTTPISELPNLPVMLVSAIGLVLLICRSQLVVKRIRTEKVED